MADLNKPEAALRIILFQAAGFEATPQAIIEICRELPQGSDNRERFDRDAELIVDLFRATLPAGTIDRLLIRLLEHRASIIRGPYKELER